MDYTVGGTGLAGPASSRVNPLSSNKMQPIDFQPSGSHELIPQFPGFAKQSPDLPVLASAFELLKTLFNISLFL
ncbi:hypothetical protein, partial [Pseudomonas putida]|uniref:hypothetical protein n=1 Tax=Pseudomonas putida TaxID=303 RepID=UPI001E5A42A2